MHSRPLQYPLPFACLTHPDALQLISISPLHSLPLVSSASHDRREVYYWCLVSRLEDVEGNVMVVGVARALLCSVVL